MRSLTISQVVYKEKRANEINLGVFCVVYKEHHSSMPFIVDDVEHKLL